MHLDVNVGRLEVAIQKVVSEEGGCCISCLENVRELSITNEIEYLVEFIPGLITKALVTDLSSVIVKSFVETSPESSQASHPKIHCFLVLVRNYYSILEVRGDSSKGQRLQSP
mgnify:CR=1 FL=1